MKIIIALSLLLFSTTISAQMIMNSPTSPINMTTWLSVVVGSSNEPICESVDWSRYDTPRRINREISRINRMIRRESSRRNPNSEYIDDLNCCRDVLVEKLN